MLLLSIGWMEGGQEIESCNIAMNIEQTELMICFCSFRANLYHVETRLFKSTGGLMMFIKVVIEILACYLSTSVLTDMQKIRFKPISVWLYFYIHMKTQAFKFWNRIVAVERITWIHKSYILFILGNKTARNIKFPRWLESFSIMFRIVLVHCIL